MLGGKGGGYGPAFFSWNDMGKGGANAASSDIAQLLGGSASGAVAPAAALAAKMRQPPAAFASPGPYGGGGSGGAAGLAAGAGQRPRTPEEVARLFAFQQQQLGAGGPASSSTASPLAAAAPSLAASSVPWGALQAVTGSASLPAVAASAQVSDQQARALQAAQEAAQRAQELAQAAAAPALGSLGVAALQVPSTAAETNAGDSTFFDFNAPQSAEVTAALRAQYEQQQEFQAQLRQYQKEKNIEPDQEGRFKEQFKPMQLCKKLVRMGHCPRGAACTFAHGIEELHPNAPEYPGNNGQIPQRVLEEQRKRPEQPMQQPEMRMKKKREMCHRLTRTAGGCLLGKMCMFAHTESELGTVALVITDRVKSQLCKYWEKGSCIYGNHCVSAHGMEEIGTLKPAEDKRHLG
eukprot:TRINITY_DN120919_c0_g1_i1.p1 TRINITY_DN120919_c0_g1~~TRINITY_DN120919_c0_g1_i1.p1  ORF type:complete len:407 (-),score=127.98 TRINITY_DN120919_c0_g1_i1:138-1358(-)